MPTSTQAESRALPTSYNPTDTNKIVGMFSDALGAVIQNGDVDLLARVRSLLTSSVADIDAIIGTSTECASPPKTTDPTIPEDKTPTVLICVEAGTTDLASGDATGDGAAVAYSASPCTTERLVRARQAVTGLESDARNVSVNVSATGSGVHIRWDYTNTTTSPIAHTAEDPSPFLPAIVSELREPSPSPPPCTIPIRKNELSVFPKPHTPRYPLNPCPPSTPRSTTPPLKSRNLSPSTPPPPPSALASARPFNHYAPLPPRPNGIRRESAFYHKSHFEIAWVPEFGDMTAPPTTYEDALPPWLSATKPVPVPAAPPPTPAGSPVRSSAPGPLIPSSLVLSEKLSSPPASEARSITKRPREYHGDDEAQRRSSRRSRT